MRLKMFLKGIPVVQKRASKNDICSLGFWLIVTLHNLVPNSFCHLIARHHSGHQTIRKNLTVEKLL